MLFLNGEWRPGGGPNFESINPATGESLWSGHAATPDDVSAVVQSARKAFPGWCRLPFERRAELLRAFGDQLHQHESRLAGLISAEVGKPLWDAASEVKSMIGKIDLTLEAFKSRRSDMDLSLPDGSAGVRFRPLGVVGVFGPFNFPGHIANGQIVPALAAGNTVVFKPSELTPLVAEETVRLWEAAGLPPGVLNLIQGGGETGQALTENRDLNALLFTGSLRTGIALQQALVGRPEVLLALELGGNNPLVVHRVQNIEAAVYATLQSAYLTSGQRCTCARRLIVTDGNEGFLKQLEAEVRRLRIGRPDSDPQPFLGPLIQPAAVDKVLQEQEHLIDAGAVAIVPSARSPLGPSYVTPGLIDVTNCTETRDEEVFGPFLQVVRVRTLSEAIDHANRTRYGLVAGILTDNREDYLLFSDQVRAGLINWNRPTTGASGKLPFGGRGLSGNHRPAGYWMVDSCNEPVAVLESPALKLPETLTPGILQS